MKEMIGHELGGPPAETERIAEAAARYRRSHAGGVSDERDARDRPGLDEAAAGNAPARAANGFCGCEPEDGLGLPEERFKMRPPPWRGSEAGVESGRPWHDPGDMAGCDAGIEKAMQKPCIGAFELVELGFDGNQEAAVAP